MTINYEISRINKIDEIETGDVVYVSLKEDGEGIWRMEDISKIRPQSEDFIKGKVINNRIEYGIEQYFFERNAKIPTTNITVEISIASSGRAKIIQLLYDGKPVEIEYEEFDIRS